MKVPGTMKHVCRVLRKRVRYLDADFGNNTQLIRRETAIYTESWIVPLLDALESGDLKRLTQMTLRDTGQSMRAGE